MTATGVEGLAVQEWVYATLVADPDLATALGLAGPEALPERVHEGVAPEGTGTPWVIVSVGEPVDLRVVGTYRVMTTAPVTVKVVCEGSSYGPAIAAAQRVDVLLDGALSRDAPITGGRILACVRLNGVQYPELAGGVQYRHLGGLYQVHAQ